MSVGMSFTCSAKSLRIREDAEGFIFGRSALAFVSDFE
ncbi:hypothetical protein KNP414_01473 [Paenibacillus mucilaginosus KNP414]|uniref:Uncharacterized protein n=1 Tax=Paenibacillus mucilaginosus (strain KNP414) TaxID=1036673 RepID=F8FMF4_PAEMK|nr:hypothetical protein KNP414_01473 [Paenibacillus mucilaginosus KNP414]